ncbi:MAG: hypothetical protein JW944_12210 [Deltaproteobacteria bacterium]|nr:hypothetical protein [Deltaproteobacteria bacterium]
MNKIVLTVFSIILFVWLIQEIFKFITKKQTGLYISLAILLSATALQYIPISQHTITGWIMAVNGNFSIPLLFLVVHKTINNVLGHDVPLFNKPTVRTAMFFGIIAGLFLYPMALGLGAYDPYREGFSFSWLFIVLMALNIILILFKNPFSFILLCAIISYNLKLLESVNLWDYFIDPFFFITSILYFLKNTVNAATLKYKMINESTENTF